MSACHRGPCPTCPWRKDRDATTIPGFRLELAEALADTCPDEQGMGPEWGSAMFACHQSKPDREVVCAGWLAAVGIAHPLARMKVGEGEWPPDVFGPGEDWPELETNYQDLIEKLRRTST